MNNTGGGYNHTLAINTGTVEEMTVTTSGTSAESRTSGVVANSVTKEGGNRFSSLLQRFHQWQHAERRPARRG